MILSLFRRLTASGSDRRIEPRGSDIDGRIILDGQRYPLKDWSRRGFSACAYAAEHYPGDKISLSVEVDLEGEPLEFDCRAVVVWVDRDRRELAGVFTELDLGLQERILNSLFSRDTQPAASPDLHA